MITYRSAIERISVAGSVRVIKMANLQEPYRCSKISITLAGTLLDTRLAFGVTKQHRQSFSMK